MSNETNLYSMSGQPIYKHERKNEFEFADTTNSAMEDIVNHFEKHIGKVSSVFHEIISDQVHVDIHVVEPDNDRNFYTIFTTGMSDKPMNIPEGYEDYRYAELMTYLPREWDLSEKALKDEINYWPVRWLKVLSRMPHEYNTWLGFGHTIPNGEPAMPYSQETKLNCMLLIYPLRVNDVRNFYRLKTNDEKIINFYYALPIYEEEMNFKLRYGTEKLIDKLQKNNIDPVLNPNRKNVCSKKFIFF